MTSHSASTHWTEFTVNFLFLNHHKKTSKSVHWWHEVTQQGEKIPNGEWEEWRKQGKNVQWRQWRWKERLQGQSTCSLCHLHAACAGLTWGRREGRKAELPSQVQFRAMFNPTRDCPAHGHPIGFDHAEGHAYAGDATWHRQELSWSVAT